MTSGGWNLDQAMRAHFPAERKPSSAQLRCAGHDAYDGRKVPTCDPMCEACVMRWGMRAGTFVRPEDYRRRKGGGK